MYAVLTPATACRALREAGFPHPAEALHIDAREATCDRTTGVVLRGTESLLTHRWREMDSNLQYRAVKEGLFRAQARELPPTRRSRTQISPEAGGISCETPRREH